MDKFDYSDGNNCLNLIFDNYSVDNQSRYDIFIQVLDEAKKYNDSLHYLACAYACHYSKSTYRPQAIIFFEKYLKEPVHPENQFLTLSRIYNDLAEDYEGEYKFRQAAQYYQKAIKLQHKRHYSSITGQYEIYPAEVKLGRLLLKIGTQHALEYWKILMEYPEYKKGDSTQSGFRRHVDIEYKNALDKHNRGYVYKPRKNKNVEQ